VDLLGGILGIVDQAYQVQVAGQDVAVVLQLMAHEAQRVLPECTAGFVQQHDRYQRALASLDQSQHFERFIQRAEAARAENQGIGLLDEEELANEEEVKGQQALGSADDGVGVLLRSEEHTSELQSRENLVCRLLLEKKKTTE